MKFILNDKEVNNIQFCDYLEVETMHDNIYFFNVSWSNNIGFYFTSEDEPPIQKIHIFDSRMILFYVSGDIREINERVKCVSINDGSLKRNFGFYIEGNLLRYSERMAMEYDLDKSRIEENNNVYVKKRYRNF